jgi:uncharacterized membrane protein YjdF
MLCPVWMAIMLISSARVHAPLTLLGHGSRRTIVTLDSSAKTRRSVLGLGAVLGYLLLGRLIDPGFTTYWWYQLLQTTATLIVVLVLEIVFAAEGGLAWQTHVIALATTYADIGGTSTGLYHAIGPYDKVVHFWSGAAFAAAVYDVLSLLHHRGVMVSLPAHRMFSAVLISFALAGVAWELYEHLSDILFHSGRVQGGWDTVHDLVCDAGGGIAAVVVLRRRDLVHESRGHRLTA